MIKGSILTMYKDIYERPPSPAKYHNYKPFSDEIFTDASLESDVSEALSANTFTFDGSMPNIGEKQTDNEGEGVVYGKGAIDDGGKGRWRSGDVIRAGGGHGGGGGDGGDEGDEGDGGDGCGKEPTTTTHARVEVVKNGGRKAGKPSPYFSSGPTVLYSRFVGDAVPKWNYNTADLSVVASEDLARLKKEPLFRWVYVLALLKSSNPNAFRHLQDQHPSSSSLVVDSLSSLTVHNEMND